MNSLDSLYRAAIEDVCANHHKIIDDWCKAYLAELHALGIPIRPGCFTLNQMEVNEKGKAGWKYWFSIEEHMTDNLERTLKQNFEENIKGLFDEACRIFFEENLGDAEFDFCMSIIQTTTTYLQSKRKKRTKTCKEDK